MSGARGKRRPLPAGWRWDGILLRFNGDTIGLAGFGGQWVVMSPGDRGEKIAGGHVDCGGDDPVLDLTMVAVEDACWRLGVFGPVPDASPEEDPARALLRAWLEGYDREAGDNGQRDVYEFEATADATRAFLDEAPQAPPDEHVGGSQSERD